MCLFVIHNADKFIRNFLVHLKFWEFLTSLQCSLLLNICIGKSSIINLEVAMIRNSLLVFVQGLKTVH